MNIRDAILKSHKLNALANDRLLEPAEYVITIHDHYHKPRVSIRQYISGYGVINGALLFELGASELILLVDDGFAGDKQGAKKLLESMLDCEIDAQ